MPFDMASSNTTTSTQGQPPVGEPNSFASMATPNFHFSRRTFPHQAPPPSPSRFNQYSGGGVFISAAPRLYGTANYPGPQQQEWYASSFDQEPAHNPMMFNDFVNADRHSQFSPSMSQSSDMYDAETVSEQAVPTAQGLTMQGMNVVNNFHLHRGAIQSQGQSIPAPRALHISDFNRPLISSINNFNGAPSSSINNFNGAPGSNNIIGHNNQIPSAVPRYGPPPYPPPNFFARGHPVGPSQVYPPPAQHSNTNPQPSADADDQPSKKRRRSNSTSVQTAVNGGASNIYYSDYGVHRLSQWPGPVTMNGFVPPPAKHLTDGNNAVTSRARNAANAASGYGNLVEDFPTVSAQPPFDIDISMVEICTFFPNAVQIPDVAMRAQKNLWGGRNISRAQLNATDSLRTISKKAAGKDSNRITKQYSGGGKVMFDIQGRWDKAIPEQRGYKGNEDLTANKWSFTSEWKAMWKGTDKEDVGFEHVTLVSIYSRVHPQKWPVGEDRLILTECLAYARDHPQLNLDTSHWGWIMQMLNLPPGASLNHEHDREAVERFKQRFPRPKPRRKGRN